MNKNVLLINDLSGVGKVALTVSLPILSHLQYNTSVLPTALLSTHTGGFPENTYLDLTIEMKKIIQHWQALALQFDGMLSGYLGNTQQIQIVETVFQQLSAQQSLCVVDPVMADGGKLYRGFSSDFPMHMRKLCHHADVLLPNMTEAFLLVDQPFQAGPYTAEQIYQLCQKLAALGPQKIVLTGVYFTEDKIGAASYDTQKDTLSFALEDKVPGHYFGTGDLLSSIVTGLLLQNLALEDAVEQAVHFIFLAIQKTYQENSDPRFGVAFEPFLSIL